jgi:hypothetical protein
MTDALAQIWWEPELDPRAIALANVYAAELVPRHGEHCQDGAGLWLQLFERHGLAVSFVQGDYYADPSDDDCGLGHSYLRLYTPETGSRIFDPTAVQFDPHPAHDPSSYLDGDVFDSSDDVAHLGLLTL